MDMIQTTYARVAPRMLPGDVIAFSGKGRLSRVIKYFTWSRVSHVGMVSTVRKHGVEVIESTSLDGKLGVEDFARVFCSELVAGALEVAGAIPPVNASEVTPINVCQWRIYGAYYYQLTGKQKQIRRYNQVPLEARSTG